MNTITFIKPVRVRCLECKDEHFIEMKYVKTDKEPRSLGFEYEHIFEGKLSCPHCGEQIRLEILVFEYPKGFINYIDIDNDSCLIADDITSDYLFLNNEPLYGMSEVTGLAKCKDCDNEELNGWSSHCKGCGLPIVY